MYKRVSCWSITAFYKVIKRVGKTYSANKKYKMISIKILQTPTAINQSVSAASKSSRFLRTPPEFQLMRREISFWGDLLPSFASVLFLSEGGTQLMWAVTRSAPREHKKKGTEEEKNPQHRRRVGASLNGHTHLQVRLCRGRSVSSSGGESGGGCLW